MSNAFEYVLAKDFVQLEIGHVDVANVAPAGTVGAWPRVEQVAQPIPVEIPEFGLDKVAPADRALAID